jgi:hypothetical protein
METVELDSDIVTGVCRANVERGNVETDETRRNVIVWKPEEGVGVIMEGVECSSAPLLTRWRNGIHRFCMGYWEPNQDYTSS